MSHVIDCNFMIRPLETVFFGQPRSFSAGEAHHSHSEFPPTPSAFQGLVRSQLLRAVEPALDLDDWSRAARAGRAALVGEPETLPGGWQLRGPFPVKLDLAPDSEDGEEPWAVPWVPAPRFLLHRPDGRSPIHARPVRSAQPSLNDLGSQERLLGCPSENALSALEGWIGPTNLHYALTGHGDWHPEQFASDPDLPPFVKREPRPGLAVDRKTATAQHAMLYFLDSLRFDRDAGMLGHFFGQVDARIPLDALTNGAGMAGRKGRPVAFEPVPRLHATVQDLLDGRHLPDTVAETDGFWLLGLTPARVAEPREPLLHAALPAGIRVRVLAALIGPPQIIGGYAMASGHSRRNRAYVPAGSAWWIALEGGDVTRRADALRLLNNAHVLGEPGEAAFGYGHTLVGLGPAIEEETP